MRKTKKRIIWISVGIVLFLLSPLLLNALVWTALMGGMWLTSPIPGRPQETYCEFPFELTYKLDEEIFTVSGTYVCEYDGIGFNEGVGKHRKWKSYIKETGEKAVFITEDEKWTVYCSVGYARDYMGDTDKPVNISPHLYCNSKESTAVSLNQEEISKLYHVEVVSWIFSEPIENTFR